MKRLKNELIFFIGSNNIELSRNAVFILNFTKKILNRQINCVLCLWRVLLKQIYILLMDRQKNNNFNPGQPKILIPERRQKYSASK